MLHTNTGNKPISSVQSELGVDDEPISVIDSIESAADLTVTLPLGKFTTNYKYTSTEYKTVAL